MNFEPVIKSPFGDWMMPEVMRYYDSIAKDLAMQFEKKNVALLRAGGGEPFFQRHDQKQKWLKIPDEDSVRKWNSRGVLEWIPEVGYSDDELTTPRYVVDLDPKPDYPWVKTKEMAVRIMEMFDKMSDISFTTCYFSGNRGFHISGWGIAMMPVAYCRDRLKTLLNEFVTEDILWSWPRKKEHGLLMDISPMKRHAVLKCIGSLSSKTGLAVMEAKDPMKFEKEMAIVKIPAFSV